jgi:membrane associated rhomboid family serine protease
MTQASVGFQCPECAHQGARRAPSYTVADLRTRPIATQALIAINVVAFVAMAVVGKSFWRAQGDVFANGALYGPLVDDGEWWRIVTGGFLHSGVLHLGMNMLMLWILGQLLEPLLGRFRFVTLYMACLVAGSFGALLLSPRTATIGASGAVFGLMGAAVIAQRRDGIDVWRNGIGGLVVVNLLLTFAVPGIAIGAHIGGLVAGVVIGAVVFALDRRAAAPWIGGVVTLGITVVLFAGAMWAAGQWMDPLFDV